MRVTPEQAALRERAQHFEAYYRTINGPNKPSGDPTLPRPERASEIPRGLPLSDDQKDHIVSCVESSVGTPPMRKICKEAGITDGPTIQELTRRHHVMLSANQSDESGQVRKSYQLGFDTPDNAAFTLAHFENVVPTPVAFDVQRFIKALMIKSLQLGVDIDAMCPRLTHSMRMEKSRREAQAYLEQPHADINGQYDNRLFKAERASSGPFRLGRKLLRPYLECRIHDCAINQINKHIKEQHAMSKSVGYGGDHPPISPIDVDNHAEYVWADLVRKAGGDEPDPNLVAALEMAGKPWVVRRAAYEIKEHTSTIDPRFNSMS